MHKTLFPVFIEIEERDPEKAYNAVRGKHTYLLESSDGGEKIARYSFIGFNPIAKLTVKDNNFDINIRDPELRDLKIYGSDPLEIMRNIILQFRLESTPVARFFGGFVGYFSYDLIRYFINLNGNTRDDLKHPDCEFLLCKNNVIFDHKFDKAYLMSHEFCNSANEIDKETIISELKEISQEMSDSDNYDYGSNSSDIGFSSNMTKEEFKSAVKTIRDYIYNGDIFQVVLSQRLETDFQDDEFLVYRKLKQINPSPYMYYLDLDERKIVGSSPEMLVRVENKRVETYPIAGTRPRGKNEEDDKKLANELLNDEKERAEHV
ncbi:MAG TPA: anthranilate synthase component I, partial [Candidatus Altiarchaeales archaeon]|nr:anthranilate synthase component I [Candidatus Altiarchaeales archaeon]